MDFVAPKDQNIAEFIDHLTSYEIHKHKLQSIKKEIEEKVSNKYKVIDQEAEMLKLRILNNRLKSHEFEANERINEIKKNNQLLLDKLLDISKGKFSAPGMKAKQPKRKTGPKSLNYVTKKKELERIDRENMKLMNRIVNQQAMLNSRKLDKEYRDKKRLQKSLQRNKMNPIKNMLKKKIQKQHQRSTGRLPALQNSTQSPHSRVGDTHSKLPQTVTNAEGRQNDFDNDSQEKDHNQSVASRENKSRDIAKTPGSQKKSAKTNRVNAKATPGKNSKYRPILKGREQQEAKPKPVAKPVIKPVKPKPTQVKSPSKPAQKAVSGQKAQSVAKPVSKPSSKAASKPNSKPSQSSQPGRGSVPDKASSKASSQKDVKAKEPVKKEEEKKEEKKEDKNLVKNNDSIDEDIPEAVVDPAPVKETKPAASKDQELIAPKPQEPKKEEKEDSIDYDYENSFEEVSDKKPSPRPATPKKEEAKKDQFGFDKDSPSPKKKEEPVKEEGFVEEPIEDEYLDDEFAFE